MKQAAALPLSVVRQPAYIKKKVFVIKGEEIIFLKPVFMARPWGGSRLRDRFHFPVADGMGECWAVSATVGGECTVFGGAYDGLPLHELWDQHRSLFGNSPETKFPLLIKILDAKEDLSIQVHPDDTYAQKHENGSLGKTECWYVLDAKPDAEIVIGHTAKNREEMRHMINAGEWSRLLRTQPVGKGDFFQIEPGCVHAIKAGTLILEIQQNSDITYRLFDYGRLYKGKPRALHINQCMDVIKTPFIPPVYTQTVYEADDCTVRKLIGCPYYTVWKTDFSGEAYLDFSGARYLCGVVVEGEGQINTRQIHKGNGMILPAGHTAFNARGRCSVIWAAPGAVDWPRGLAAPYSAAGF